MGGFHPTATAPSPASATQGVVNQLYKVEISVTIGYDGFITNTRTGSRSGGALWRRRTGLREALPDFGEPPALAGAGSGVAGKAVHSHSTGRVSGRTGAESDRDADWGRHETRGVDGAPVGRG